MLCNTTFSESAPPSPHGHNFLPRGLLFADSKGSSPDDSPPDDRSPLPHTDETFMIPPFTTVRPRASPPESPHAHNVNHLFLTPTPGNLRKQHGDAGRIGLLVRDSRQSIFERNEAAMQDANLALPGSM